MKAPCPRGLRAFLSSLAGFALGFSAATWLFSPWAAQRSAAAGGVPGGVPGGGGHCWWQGGFGRGGALLMGAGRSGASSFSFAFSFPFSSSSSSSSSSTSREETEWGGARTRSFVYVGVITAHKYLSTRAWAAYRTWAPTVPGRVEFFTSDGSSSELPLPLVALPGVDDVYPPQKKSFMMLKYMHDHYLDQFEWFVRADDDAYIRGDRLEQFLRRLNSSEPHYLGQTGLGTTEELGKLALEPGENFCMGGPGMVFSREALRRLAPNVGPCLREMHTGHEDVEVGRCVRRFADTQCVWSYEMQQLFYEHYERNKRGYIQDLPASKLHRAITLHPNKRPAYQYRLHSLLLASRAQELRHKTIELHRQILQTATEAQQLLANGGGDDEANAALDVSSEDRRLGASPSFMRFHPRDRQHVLEWDFFTGTHLWSARAGAQGPRQALSGGALRSALDGTVVAQLMEMIDARARARRRAIDFREILYGYARVNPLHGADYVLDVLMTYRRSEGKRAAVPVRRHAYLQQTFGRAEFAEEHEMQAAEFAAAVDASAAAAAAAAAASADGGGGIAGGNAGDGSLLAVKLSNPLGLFAPFGRTPVEAVLAAAGPSRERIHMLVPLAGRYKAFVRFMENFERVCLARPQNIKLVLLLFRPSSDDGGGAGDAVGRPEALVEEYRRRYPKAEIEVLSVTGPFSRGLALEVGSSQFPGDALLFFCDVDLAFTADALQRCRDNAGRVDPTTGSVNDDGRVGQVYFPVVFSQYDPRIVHSGGGRSPTSDDSDGRHEDDPFDFSDRAGMWRAFGYGIACLHRADLARAGGFDTSITGWGLEDVDLFGKAVAARAGAGAGGGLAVFRSPDPGVAHLHHEVRCDPALEPRQLRMCRNSKASTLGSARQLAHTWLAHAEAAAVAAGEDEGGGWEPGRLGPTATGVGGDGAASR